jgi:hypothetical protein
LRIAHRKKKRSRTDQDRASAAEEAQRAARAAESAERARAARSASVEEGDKSGSAAEGGLEGASGGVKKRKTAAEEKFDKIQEERVRNLRSILECSILRLTIHRLISLASGTSKEEGNDEP